MLEWLKDKSYYRKKYNTLENEIKIQRKVYAKNTIAWTEQLEEMQETIEYKDAKLRFANKENKKLKERIKELEIGGKK